MNTLTTQDVEHIFEALRKGLVPERGIDAFAVGIDKQQGEIHRQLDLARSGEGTIKFFRGGYGCGKKFVGRLAGLDAQAQGFATSFVVVSDNDLRFHRFDDVYRKAMTELGTASCPRGALGDILDRWIGRVEQTLVAAGENEDADGLDDLVSRRLDADLAALTGGKAPQDFVRVVQTIFDLKQRGEFADAGALISWLSGSGNVGASAKKAAAIKGDIGSGAALDYLRGVLEIIKAADYAGLVIVIDEAETILRMRKDSRHKSLNGIRQIADAAGSYPGLVWMITGTPEFFDTRHGVAGLPPLHDRIRFLKQGRFASLRQAQLELTPFDAERLKAVALRLRELYPAKDQTRLDTRISTAFVERLVADVTAGFKGDVGVVPRQFLREFVTQMDLVDEHPDYDPATEYGFSPSELRPEEEHVLLDQRREAMRRFLKPVCGGIQAVEDEFLWWTFAGGRINSTLRYALAAVGRDWSITPDNYHVKVRGQSLDEHRFLSVLTELSQREFWENGRLWEEVAHSLPSYRLSKFQPLMPTWVEREVLAAYLLDVPGAQHWASSVGRCVACGQKGWDGRPHVRSKTSGSTSMAMSQRTPPHCRAILSNSPIMACCNSGLP